ncbi:nitrite reductase small subunit NirD [Bacillus sp. Marseille-P3661]|uniref:nitrite reductase small subunit NirD n=1 Tax=Bacillus sp. Marseille-P3661 TaxID=1936234 RepID=UPI000C834C97|nr:nitrite reductase small subunit NirD [Bacillus sp. Marseille-P3661]
MEQTLQRVKVGTLIELPKEIGKTIRIGSHNIAVFRLANNKVRAIENKCPHRGGVLAEGMVSGEHVFCPMHDWKICMTDGKVQEPDTGCVNTYQVEIENGDVFIMI